jgi:hypothetical protein
VETPKRCATVDPNPWPRRQLLTDLQVTRRRSRLPRRQLSDPADKHSVPEIHSGPSRVGLHLIALCFLLSLAICCRVVASALTGAECFILSNGLLSLLHRRWLSRENLLSSAFPGWSHGDLTSPASELLHQTSNSHLSSCPRGPTSYHVKQRGKIDASPLLGGERHGAHDELLYITMLSLSFVAYLFCVILE